MNPIRRKLKTAFAVLVVLAIERYLPGNRRHERRSTTRGLIIDTLEGIVLAPVFLAVSAYMVLRLAWEARRREVRP